MTVAQPTAGDGGSVFRLAPIKTGAPPRSYPLDLHYLRASGLAQTRLQLAVLAGNRRRALEQIDRLVAIDGQLQRMAGDDTAWLPAPEELEAELTDQRLAIATEKLALTAGIEMPRLEPAFGAGMAPAIAHGEEIEIVEHETLKNRIFHVALWGAGFLVLCVGVAAAAVAQL